MKRFCIRIIILFLLLVAIDFVLGHFLQFVTNQIRIGGQGRDNYIANLANEDILVFGSSKAVHHYNPKIIEDSLGMSCYNCGQDGNGIILDYGRLLMIKERHQPKTIIVDVNPSFDLILNDNHKYLGWLKYHYDKKIVRPIFDVVDKRERIKMNSLLYRYNSTFLQNIVVFKLGKAYDNGYKGFRPINDGFDKMKIKEGKVAQYSFDNVKLTIIKDFINQAQGSDLYFVMSPIWYGMDSELYEPVQSLCKDFDIPFIDFSNDDKYVHNDLFFNDGTHLNHLGADEFTKDLVLKIQNINK